MRKNFYFSIVLVCLCFLKAPSSLCANLPEAVLLPWQVFLSNQTAKSIDKKLLAAAHQELSTQLFIKSQTLAEFLGKEKLLNNFVQHAYGMSVGELKDKQTKSLLLISPILCKLQDNFFVVTIISQLAEGALLSIGQERIDFTKGNLSQALISSYERAKNLPSIDLTTNLKIALNHKVRITEKDDAETNSLDLLFSQSLLKLGYRVLNFVDTENILFLQRVFSLQSPLRPTRYLRLEWLKPISFAAGKMRYSWIEGVFSSQIIIDKMADFQLSNSDNQYALELDKNFVQLLRDEQKSLLYTDFPQVARVFGRWVYLDRGRAWGLQINDRLMSTDKKIRGHVVKFFGPEEKIISPRGFSVHEGAIVYVREGLGKLKEGVEFLYDNE